MHRRNVSSFLEEENKLSEPSRSSEEAPKVISNRSVRCCTTVSGLIAVEVAEASGWPLAPGEATSMVEEVGRYRRGLIDETSLIAWEQQRLMRLLISRRRWRRVEDSIILTALPKRTRP